MPAEPQQISASFISLISIPGICFKTCRGSLRTPCACAKWQASWYAAETGSGCRSATAPISYKNSETSLTLSENTLALSAYSGSSRKRYAYSLIVEPQPAALTITLSRFSASKVSMVFLAKSRDSSPRPAWVLKAPQQPWFLGARTSQPSAASTRTVAALTWEKKTCCTQPMRKPTLLRFSPTGEV